MNIGQNLVLTRDEALQVVRLDAEKLATEDHNFDIDSFVGANVLTYYIAINTWCTMIGDCDRWASRAVKTMIVKSGLLKVIKDCDEDALRLVKGEDPVTDSGILLHKISENSAKAYFGLGDRNVFKEDLATSLQLMRYLKRISLTGNTALEKRSLSQFLSNENMLKMEQRSEHPVWLVRELREILSDVLDWDAFLQKAESIEVMDYKIPTGATYEGLRSLGEKLDVLSRIYPEAFPTICGFPYIYPDYVKYDDPDCVKVQAVPKSYKASRIIAMEPLLRQAYAGAVADLLIPLLPENLDITDQTRNQQLAMQGSISADIATLDASNASDLISKTLFREIFPTEVVSFFDPVFSHHHEVNGVRRTMQMMSTAGHSLTFIFETLVYYAIAEAATRIYSRFSNRERKVLGIVSVYGDDVILPSEVAPTAIELYSYLGLKINVDKSFISGHYRESCGEEYLDGVNLTTVYYPRFPVVGKLTSKSIELGVRMYRDQYRGKIDDSTTMLVDLQKRLFTVSYDASMFVWDIVTIARPRITTSRHGAVCNDLWGGSTLAGVYNPAERLRDAGIPIPASVVSLCAAEKHSYASIQYTLKGIVITEQQMRVFNAYKYYHFLKTGPTYATPLDELLGVSEPPLDLAAVYGIGRLVWRYEIV